MPIPLADFATAAYQDKIYCISGAINEVYDTKNDSWTNISSVENISIFEAVVDNGIIYCVGDDSNYIRSMVQSYNISSGIWTRKASAPQRTGLCALAVLDDKIYAIRGAGDYSHGICQVYSIENDSWTEIARSPTFSFDQHGAATSGAMAPKRIYVFCFPNPDLGANPYASTYSTEIYNPQTASWAVGPNVPNTPQGYGVAVVNDTIYLIGGLIITGYRTEMNAAYGMPIFATVGTNFQYTPAGYGTPDPNYQPPTPSPAPSLNPPTPIQATPTPTQQPTPTPTAISKSLQTPTQVKPAGSDFQLDAGWVVLGVVIVFVGVAVWAVLRRNQHSPKK
jgi:hypothetical protein